MKKTLSHVAPAVFFVFFLGFLSIIAALHAQATPSVCCLNGQLTPSVAPNDCQTKGGSLLTNNHEAVNTCALSAKCWCCDNGRAWLTTKGTCNMKSNPCYKTKQEVDSLCSAPCFCCINGSITQTGAQACKSKNGACYATLNDANQRCQKPK